MDLKSDIGVICDPKKIFTNLSISPIVEKK